MKNQTHNFYLSPIGVTDNGLEITVTSEDLLRMHGAAKRTQQKNNHLSFSQICYSQAIGYVSNFVQENYAEYFDLYDFQEENCIDEIAIHIIDTSGEWEAQLEWEKEQQEEEELERAERFLSRPRNEEEEEMPF